MKPRFASFLFGMSWLVLAALLAACAPAPALSKPVTKIISPASNLQVPEGQILTIESTSTDSRGVAQVDRSKLSRYQKET